MTNQIKKRGLPKKSPCFSNKKFICSPHLIFEFGDAAHECNQVPTTGLNKPTLRFYFNSKHQVVKHCKTCLFITIQCYNFPNALTKKTTGSSNNGGGSFK